MSLSASLVPQAAGRLALAERGVRELQRIGPQPWVYVGTYPGDPFTRFESPSYQNGLTFVAPRRIRYRWGIDGSFEWDGVFDLTAGYVSGDVGFNVLDNSDEFEGEGIEAFIPLELAVGVWSAAVFVLYAAAAAPYVAGDAVVYFPIVADPIPP